MHRRIFIWFGVTILLTLVVSVATVGILAHSHKRDHKFPEQLHRFGSARFEERWDDVARREALAREIAAIGFGVELRGPHGELLSAHGPKCDEGAFELPVLREGRRVGSAGICFAKGDEPPWAMAVALFMAGLVLWLASRRLARWLTRPLDELVRVTSEIGAGQLASRARLGRHHPGEIGRLAESINDMAVRIERQLADQRELLAAVSHEVRTPLGHLAVLVELLRERGADPKLVSDVELEVHEIDALIGELLASSRLDFSALDPHPLDARDLAERALERAHLAPELLVLEVSDTALEGDATLLARALANLLDNAEKHGGGVLRLTLRDAPGGGLELLVDDGGPGFTPQGLVRAFESFYRGGSGAEASSRRPERARSSLGLGLALVRRIARAHGGDAWAENLPSGGARVGFRVQRRAGSKA